MPAWGLGGRSQETQGVRGLSAVPPHPPNLTSLVSSCRGSSAVQGLARTSLLMLQTTLDL